MNVLWQHLSDPEYVHVLINPLPVYGLSIAVLSLVLALFLRTQRLTIAALVLIFVCAMTAWPTYNYGEAAYDRIKAMSDPLGEQWLDEHMARGMKMIWMFYVLAGVAAIGVVGVVKWPRLSFAVTVGTLAWGAATLGAGGYIAYAGGHVRHREFRFEPPPTPQMSQHEHSSMEHGETPGKPAETERAKPMDHGSMPGMEPAKSPQAKEPPMQHDAATPAPPTQEQLEASRLQLEASRLQLEASRKQLEAAEAAKGQTPSPSPAAKPSATPDGHQH
jgi:cell division protein FtsL